MLTLSTAVRAYSMATANDVTDALEALPDAAESQYSYSLRASSTVTVSPADGELWAALTDPDSLDYIECADMQDERDVSNWNGSGEISDYVYLINSCDLWDCSADTDAALRAQLQTFWNGLPATVRLRLVAFTPEFDPGQFAHDFALTRNHHGAGYWDRSDVLYSGLNNYLTDRAHKFGEHDGFYLTFDSENHLTISED